MTDRPLTALVADDQPAEVAAAVDALRDLGHRVVLATDFHQAREGARRTDLDVAVLDLGWYLDRDFDNPGGRDHARAGYDLDDLVQQHSPQAVRILYTTRTQDGGESVVAEAARRGMLLVKKHDSGSQQHLASVACFVAEQVRAVREGARMRSAASRLRMVLLVVTATVALALLAAAGCWLLVQNAAVAVVLLTVVSALSLSFAVVVLLATGELSTEQSESVLEVVKAFLAHGRQGSPPADAAAG